MKPEFLAMKPEFAAASHEAHPADKERTQPTVCTKLTRCRRSEPHSRGNSTARVNARVR